MTPASLLRQDIETVRGRRVSILRGAGRPGGLPGGISGRPYRAALKRR